MENQNVLAPSSTTDELIQIQSQPQLAPVPIHIGPERRVFFNDIVPKWVFWIVVFPMDGFIGVLRAFGAMVAFNVHWTRTVFFFILQFVQLFFEVNLMLYLNAYDHTSALRQSCTISFISFVLLGNELFSAWEDTFGLSEYFLYLALYRGIVFLTLMILLVYVVRVYKANERMKREDETTP